MRVDKADDFMKYIHILNPKLKEGMFREYRFCADVVGDGVGLRKRLKNAGLKDWRFDFAWPNHKVAVEIDGGQWMAGGGRHNTDEDRLKINTATTMGWKVLRFSVKTMHDDPMSCIKKIVEILK